VKNPSPDPSPKRRGEKEPFRLPLTAFDPVDVEHDAARGWGEGFCLSQRFLPRMRSSESDVW
jgi:hypothetical protein